MPARHHSIMKIFDRQAILQQCAAADEHRPPGAPAGIAAHRGCGWQAHAGRDRVHSGLRGMALCIIRFHLADQYHAIRESHHLARRDAVPRTHISASSGPNRVRSRRASAHAARDVQGSPASRAGHAPATTRSVATGYRPSLQSDGYPARYGAGGAAREGSALHLHKVRL
jgi:hypothetical protein